MSEIGLRWIKDETIEPVIVSAMTQTQTPGDRPAKPARPGLRPSVVIMEDDPALLSALQFSMEAEGYEVHAFSRQTELLARRQVFLDAACVIIDYRLTPLNGLRLFALMEAMGLTAPAILMTSHPDEDCRRYAKRLGVRIVEKPLLTDGLSREIADLIASAP